MKTHSASSLSKKSSEGWAFLIFCGIIEWGEKNDKKSERRKNADGNDMHGRLSASRSFAKENRQSGRFHKDI